MTMSSYKRQSLVAFLMTTLLPVATFAAKYYNDVYYLCADWGPDLETKESEKADEAIYFVKMILFSAVPESDEEQIPKTEGSGARLWLCRMNWDGSNKKEICELWPGQSPGVAPEPGGTWLDVCPKAKKAAFSVEYGNGITFGLWEIGLDGKNLRRLAVPKWTEKDKRAYVHPSFSPDGEQVVFSAVQKHPDIRPGQQSKLGIVRMKTGEVRWLTDGPKDDHPDWSPDGDWIVYTHYRQYTSSIADRRITLVRPDGSENKPVMGQFSALRMTIDDKQPLFAWWPSWSTDGKWIYALAGNPSFYIVDAQNAKTVARKTSQNSQVGMAKLGRKGILNTGGGTWLVVAEAPDFSATKEIYVGPRAHVPSPRYRDLSTYDLQWGEPKQ